MARSLVKVRNTICLRSQREDAFWRSGANYRICPKYQCAIEADLAPRFFKEFAAVASVGPGPFVSGHFSL
jgi:hypothetical protein